MEQPIIVERGRKIKKYNLLTTQPTHDETLRLLRSTLAGFRQTKQVNRRRSSYQWKHIYEPYIGYVSNEEFIAVARELQFKITPIPGSPNVWLNISETDAFPETKTVQIVSAYMPKSIVDNFRVFAQNASAFLTPQGEETFQSRVLPWMLECFGPAIPFDKVERNHRFLEEALELVQACGCSRSEAHQLVDYVFDRDQGDVNQEVGGVMVTLAALCIANRFDMHEAGEAELARIWTKIEQIRAKQAAKPKHSPLPQ